MVSESEYQSASRRGKQMHKHVSHAIAARYEGCLQRVLITLSNRLEIAFNPADHQTLHHATAEQLSTIEISPGGYELYFPLLDDGVYVPSLLQGIVGTKSWMQKQATADKEAFERKADVAA